VSWLPFYVPRARQVVEAYWVTMTSPWPPVAENIRALAGAARFHITRLQRFAGLVVERRVVWTFT
jgi:hypothetical protein